MKKTKKSNSQTQIANRIYASLAVIAAVVLLAIGGLALWAHNFTTAMVRTELAAQKVYFPEKGSEALDPAIYPGLQKYAGQLVDTPAEAKAYANEFIAVHLEKIGGGKTYSEVSEAWMADTSNTTLAQQRQTLFMGETLRGILLTSGYGFGTVGEVAGIAAIVAFLGSIVLFVLAGFFYVKQRG